MPESQTTTTMVANYQNILFDTEGQIAIHFGALPKTSTGKIRKNVLRHQSHTAVEGDS